MCVIVGVLFFSEVDAVAPRRVLLRARRRTAPIPTDEGDELAAHAAEAEGVEVGTAAPREPRQIEVHSQAAVALARTRRICYAPTECSGPIARVSSLRPWASLCNTNSRATRGRTALRSAPLRSPPPPPLRLLLRPRPRPLLLLPARTAAVLLAVAMPARPHTPAQTLSARKPRTRSGASRTRPLWWWCVRHTRCSWDTVSTQHR
jgi:hypothetical protein